MTIDISKIRPGDEVTVRMTVLGACDGPGGFCLRLAPLGQPVDAWAWSKRWDVVSHTPKAIEIGDRVKVNGDKGFVVQGRHGDVYWCVRAEPLRFESAHTSVLERLP